MAHGGFHFLHSCFLCLNSVNKARPAQHPACWDRPFLCSFFFAWRALLAPFGHQGSLSWDLTTNSLSKAKSALLKLRVIHYSAICFPHYPQDLFLHYFFSVKLCTNIEMRFESMYRAGHTTLSEGRKFWKLSTLLTLEKICNICRQSLINIIFPHQIRL